MGSSRMSTPGSVGGIPLVPPSQPTHAPSWLAITGRSAVTSPPGDSSQPPPPWRTGSRLATATTGGADGPVRASETAELMATSGRGGAARHRPGGPAASLRLVLEDLDDLLDGAVLGLRQEPGDEGKGEQAQNREADHDPAQADTRLPDREHLDEREVGDPVHARGDRGGLATDGGREDLALEEPAGPAHADRERGDERVEGDHDDDDLGQPGQQHQPKPGD